MDGCEASPNKNFLEDDNQNEYIDVMRTYDNLDNTNDNAYIQNFNKFEEVE